MGDWRDRAEVAANSMMDAGAQGVALMGSYARGDEHSLSDVDIVALGTGEPEFREEGGVILSLSWVEAATALASFDNPEDLVITVPGWRTAVPMHDPSNEVARLIAAARDWVWTSDLEDKAREWLARQVVGYCEEVFGLVRSLESRVDYPAAVVRSVFAIRCANLIAVRHGVLYESEKYLWNLVADRQGAEWRKAQEAAFALDGEPLGVSARAGLRLYKMVVDEAWTDLTDVQRVVVGHALQELDRVVHSTNVQGGPRPT